MAFRPTLSLEAEIEAAIVASGMTKTQWLEQAARAFLKNPPEPAGGEEQPNT